MNRVIRSALYTSLAPLVKHRVYVQRTGLAAGLKRRGGFGFLPLLKPLSQEHQFLAGMDWRGKTVYDVGGHIGVISMFFARAVGEWGRVVTFEPNPQSYAVIMDHIQLNGLTNVQVLAIGLGERRGSARFVVPSFSSARGTAAPDRQERYLPQAGVQVYQIEIDTLDNQIAAHSLPQPDFVKIDVEGLEVEVLHGMSHTLREHRPELLIELHGASAQPIMAYLLDQGYGVYHIEAAEAITQETPAPPSGSHLHASPRPAVEEHPGSRAG